MSKQSPPQLPDDDQLQQYLAGVSSLSRGYRDESREVTPPELDRAVLRMAQAAAPRRRRASRWQLPLALAATLLIGVPLAWNVTRQAPRVHEESVAMAPAPPQQPLDAFERSGGATTSDDAGAALGAAAESPAKEMPPPQRSLKRSAQIAAAPEPSVLPSTPDREVPAVAARAATPSAQAAPAVAMQSLTTASRSEMADAAAAPVLSEETDENRADTKRWVAPAAWIVAQSPEGENRVGVDLSAPYAGGAAALLQGGSGLGWIELRQTLPAAPYRGLRLRLRGMLRPNLVQGYAQLWLRAGAADVVAAQDRTDSQVVIVTGIQDWQPVDVTLDVPVDAEAIALGVTLQRGQGEVHVDQISLVGVPAEMAPADLARAQIPLPQPRNAGFEAPLSP
ncbi:hypothetical protein E4T66_03095 [Sinimarinibacterium sp. CAU 1509]|uniref:hypothetical protein n=1 Tax=Sinimarinibacterium sp. CAU 1509 TaxID=2562283 RepID=UPI0010AD261A|nr:hypothetical protein [Sinimarinibacterium sp. CAU 1509]TJY65221.1 hypothetical protein E4T66_03095 [Sinimarinibacterium sp. CAU 1509]